MHIGAHVPAAGGPAKSVERGAEAGATSIQIFNQSPRMWRGRDYTADEVAAFHEAHKAHKMGPVLIHAVYLLNCASEDKELRDKSLASLKLALRDGDALKAHAVVLHPGSAETDRCPLHLENTAGAGGTLGRSFEELAALMDAAGGGKRLGLCLDSCHLLASGYDIRTAASLAQVVEEFEAQVGLDRLHCLHVNDSKTPLGSNRDRHAPLGEGEIGEEGCAAFLSEPAFDGLPALFEGPGVAGKQVEAEDIAIMRRLREQGLKSR